MSGSDEQETEFTARLRASGARIFIGHAEQNIAGAELVLVSSAVASANPEVGFGEGGVKEMQVHTGDEKTTKRWEADDRARDRLKKDG